MRLILARAAAAAALAGGLTASAAVLRAGDEVARESGSEERRLYVESGPVARRLLLSFDALGADVYWIRAIQHYGRDRRSSRQTGRFELLNPLLDLTTSLDPHFTIAYRSGAVFLAEPPPSGPGRVDQAMALLQKGLRHNPERWQFAFDIGFIYYWYGAAGGPGPADFVAAADWFERAATMPDAPLWLRQLAATTRAGGGDLAGARRLLQQLNASDEAWVRQVARRGLDQLAAREAIDDLQGRLDAHMVAHRAWPQRWAQFVPGLPPDGTPLDPSGTPYEYDPVTRRIGLSPHSSLFPLPRTPGAM
jgi:hypothetical protein